MFLQLEFAEDLTFPWEQDDKESENENDVIKPKQLLQKISNSILGQVKAIEMTKIQEAVECEKVESDPDDEDESGEEDARRKDIFEL